MRLAPTAIASQRHQGWHLPAQAFEPAVARVIKITRDPMALAATIGIIPETIGPEAANLTAPFAVRRRGIEAKIIAGAQVPASDPTLVRMLTKAHRWMLARQDGTALTEIAHRDGMRSPTLAPASPSPSFRPGSRPRPSTAPSRASFRSSISCASASRLTGANRRGSLVSTAEPTPSLFRRLQSRLPSKPFPDHEI